MARNIPKFKIHLARSTQDLHAAQHLRYQVFVRELGGDGPLVDHENERECDEYDPFYDHLILLDETRGAEIAQQAVGVYRVLGPEGAQKLGRYYSESEYDLTALRTSGRRLLELGRSCLHADYRGGTAMHELWGGLSDYVVRNDIEILFGVASFHGTDVEELAEPLSLLYHRYLAPVDLRVRCRSEHYQSMNLRPAETLDRLGAMRAIPSLIKAYLRLGGFVGDGAYVDHAFNTTDVCLIMDTARMSENRRKYYLKARR